MTTRRLRGLLLAALALAAIAAPAAAQEDGPDYSRKGADTCFQCHDDQVTLAVFRTKHAVPSDSNSPFGHGQLQCEACHGPGGDHSGRVRRGKERPPVVRFGSDSGTPVEVQNGYCLDCHLADAEPGWHGGSHDLNTVACETVIRAMQSAMPCCLGRRRPRSASTVINSSERNR